MFDNEYIFTGKHAQYVKNLVSDEKLQLFNRNLDVYILAPIVGYLNGRKGEVDKDEPTTKIFTQQILNERGKIKFIYRLIMLLDENTEPDSEKRVERAFRGESDEETFKQNSEICNKYLLGGVEYLHEKLYEGRNDKWDRLEALNELVDDFNETLEMRASEEDVYEIIRKYE